MSANSDDDDDDDDDSDNDDDDDADDVNDNDGMTKMKRFFQVIILFVAKPCKLWYEAITECLLWT